MYKAQMSYTNAACDTPLINETVGQLLKRTVEANPDHEAIVVPHQNYRITYRQLWDQLTDAAKAIIAGGANSGDRIGLWATNRYEWVLMQYAAARAGVVLVGINPACNIQELVHVLKHSEASMLIMSHGAGNIDFDAASVRDQLPHLKKVYTIENDWSIFLECGQSVSNEQLTDIESNIEPDDPVMILHTSDTAGTPKYVTLTHRNVLNSGFFIGEHLHLGNTDRVAIPVPLYHPFGAIWAGMAAVTHGSCIVLTGEHFDAANVMQAVQDERCTTLIGTPLMYIGEMNLPGFDGYSLASLRNCVIAGSQCPESVIDSMLTKMTLSEVNTLFGSIESSAMCVRTIVCNDVRCRSANSTILPHIEVKIIDAETGETVPRGTPGQICVHGCSVMPRYWNNATDADSAIDNEHWLHTDNIGVMTDNGLLRITGRVSNTLIRGGESIIPAEIEEFLLKNNKVRAVQVFGIPDPTLGEEIMAWVIPTDNAELTGNVLREFCKGRIAASKIPRYWKFVSSFPTTTAGKVSRHKMREIAMRELNLDDKPNL